MQCLHRANQGLGHAGTRREPGESEQSHVSHSPFPGLIAALAMRGEPRGDSAREGMRGCDGTRLAVPLLLRSARARIQAHTRCSFPARVPREGCPSPGMQRYIYGKGLELRLRLRSRPKSGEGSTGGDRCGSGLPGGAQHWPFHRVPDTHPGWARGVP